MILAQAVINIQDELAKEAPHTQFDLGALISKFAGFGLILAAVASFGFLVLGGVKWTIAGGDKGKVESARADITNAIIGLTVTASTFAVFGIIQYLFGIDIVKF